jgi:hypothetical protein
VREGLRRASLLAAWRIKSPRVAVSTVLVACVVLAVCALYVCMHAQLPTAHMYVSIRTKRRVFNERASASDEARIQLGTFFFFGQGCLINNRVLSLPALSTLA